MAEDRLGQFRPSRADQARQPHHLAGSNFEADVLDATGCQTTDGENHRTGISHAAIEQFGDRAPDHQLHDLAFRDRASRPLRDQAAVAQNRDPVRELHHLAHAVRDVENRDAFAAQLPHDAEQALRLVLGERGRRLVEREQAYARAQRPHDLHQLALRRSKISRAGPGPELVLQAEGGQHLAGSPREIAAIEEDAADAPKVAEKQILGDRQVGDDVRFLVDHPDAVRVRVGRRAKRLRVTADLETSLVGLVHALQDAHQRRLSGAVLADEREYLARPDGEAHAFERLNDAEALGHAAHSEDRCLFEPTRPGRPPWRSSASQTERGEGLLR